MIVNDNIRRLLFENKISNIEFSKKVNVSKGTVDNAATDGNITVNFIYKLIDYFPKLNVDWLFTDRGNMYFREKDKLRLMVEDPEGTYETKIRLLMDKNHELVNENNELKDRLIDLQNRYINDQNP